MLITDEDYDQFFNWLIVNSETFNKMQIDKKDYKERCEFNKTILKHICDNLHMFHWIINYNYDQNSGKIYAHNLQTTITQEMLVWFEKIILRGMEPVSHNDYQITNGIKATFYASKVMNYFNINFNSPFMLFDFIKERNLKIIEKNIPNYIIKPFKIEETKDETNFQQI